MARPVGTACAHARRQDDAFHGAKVQAGVFGRAVGVGGQSGVGMKFLDADLHVESLS